MPDIQREPIAVVGVSSIYPGSLEKKGFWRDIKAGRDMMREVPSTHWLISDYYDPDPKAPEKTYCKRGAFLSEIDFDALRFGLPPNLLPSTDTTQLLALVAAKRVLDEATLNRFDEADKERISVILGVVSPLGLAGNMWSKLQRPVWIKALRESGIPEGEAQGVCDRIAASYPEWVESTFPGLLGNVVAGRIANRLDLGGTNCITDAACASSFAALTMAVDQLYLGDADMVVTGGVDAMNDILMYMCFSKTPAISKSGDCRPFSDKGDGTMLGEGAGVVALKRLSDAERDGNRIYAVLKGIGSSSDGKAKSVYAPVPQGQAKAIRRAYQKSGFDPGTIELVEAHGTGTLAGDAAELGGLSSVYDESPRKDRQWCALGSVKSQIGHTKAAAGAAGLFKVVMALHHKTLPPTIKVDRPHEKFGFPKTPFYLNTETRPWVRPGDHPRRAAVSAFGFGGSNYHVSLEEYAGKNRAARFRSFPAELVVASGKDAAALAARVEDLLSGVSETEGLLARLAYESQNSYDASAPERLAVVAAGERDLREKLAAGLARVRDAGKKAPAGVFYSGDSAEAGKIAFMFSGQGGQYVGMGKDLALAFDAAIEPYDFAAGIALDGGTRLDAVIYPRPVFDDKERAAQEETLRRTEWAQPALGAVSLSQLALMDALGVRPFCLAGHSFGELTALHAAGAMDRETFFRAARKRGELMAASADKSGGKGSMLAVMSSVEKLGPALAELGLDLVMANQNSGRQTVLSGATPEISRAESELSKKGFAVQRLKVSTAFHSPMMRDARGPFLAFLESVKIGPASLPVYANASAKPYAQGAKAVRTGLADQIVSPVRFAAQVEAMYADGVRTFIELGPGKVVSSLVRDNLKGRPHNAVSIDQKGKDGIVSLWNALGALSAAGVRMDLKALWKDFGAPEDPRAAEKPAITVKISGVNHGRPYPPEGGSAALPKPVPPRAKIPETVSRPEEQMSEPMKPAQYDSRTAAWLEAFREMERTTAASHTAYQKAMADSHMQFLRMAEASLANMTRLLGGEAPAGTPLPSPAPVFQAPPPIAPISVPAVPQSLIEETAAAFDGLAAPEIPAPKIHAAPAAAPVVNGASRVAAAAPAGGLAGLNEALIAVVADKTGYPAEMLKPEMDYESDLGVDSIKRVEILAALKERVPNLPEVPASELAALSTIGQTVSYIEGKSGTAPASSNGATRAQVPAAAPPAASAGGLEGLNEALIAVVADKTGYPAEMLKPEMDYESDLGVDSIKRVEILAALKERVPDLPEVPASELAALSTIGQTVAYIQSRSGTAPSEKKSPLTPV